MQTKQQTAQARAARWNLVISQRVMRITSPNDAWIDRDEALGAGTVVRTQRYRALVRFERNGNVREIWRPGHMRQ